MDTSLLPNIAPLPLEKLIEGVLFLQDFGGIELVPVILFDLDLECSGVEEGRDEAILRRTTILKLKLDNEGK